MRIRCQSKSVLLSVLFSIALFSLVSASSPLENLTKAELNKQIMLAVNSAPEAKTATAENAQPPSEAKTEAKKEEVAETGGEVIIMNAWVPQTTNMTEPSQGASSSDTEDEKFQQSITLHFKDADLQNVIRIMAAQTNLNILMNEKDVKGTITVDLDNVKLGPALDAVLRTNGLTYIKTEGIVRIIPLSQKVEEVERKLIRIPLNWVEAKKVKESLELKIGTGDTSKAAGGGEGGVNFILNADEVSNSLIIFGTPTLIQQVQDIVAQIDVPEKQVMLEARMVDLTETARRDLGLSWNLYRLDEEGVSPKRTSEVRYPDGSIESDSGKQFALDDIAMSTPHNPASAFMWSYGDKISIFGKDFDLASTLSALEQRGLASTLHNPKVITLNNIEANIELVTQNPYLEAVQGQTGEFISNEVKFKDSGVKLKVKPYITNNGYVRMSISPEQMILAEISSGIPVINSRKATTNVIVKDEDTVSISGLRQVSASSSTDGVPWFHNIPLFGWLFKGTGNRQEKIENVLFVTPHIVKDPTLSTEQQLQYDQIEYNWELPDYFYDETNLRQQPKGWTK